MRAAQIVLGAEYMVCRYPNRYKRWPPSDRGTWQHFEETAVRVRVVESDERVRSGYRCEVLSPQTGEALHDEGMTEVFRAVQILVPWEEWATGFLDWEQEQADKQLRDSLAFARREAAKAERSAADWRQRTLQRARDDLARAATVFDIAPPTEEEVAAYIELLEPDGCPYDESVREKAAEAAALEREVAALDAPEETALESGGDGA